MEITDMKPKDKKRLNQPPAPKKSNMRKINSRKERNKINNQLRSGYYYDEDDYDEERTSGS